jgi:hypothetical protein
MYRDVRVGVEVVVRTTHECDDLGVRLSWGYPRVQVCAQCDGATDQCKRYDRCGVNGMWMRYYVMSYDQRKSQLGLQENTVQGPGG